jgi:hypothetical protein
MTAADDRNAAILRAIAEHAPEWFTPVIPDGYLMPYGILAARTALLRGANALDRLGEVEAAARSFLEADAWASFGEYEQAAARLRDALDGAS